MENKITKSYIIKVFTLALPVMFQQFITAFASLIDNLMVGSNGKHAINAVGASGSIFFVIMLLGYGVTNGVGIFIAQQFGSKKFKGMHHTFLIGIIASVILGTISAVFVYAFKDMLINIFTRVEIQHILAYKYLKIAVFTYPIILVSMCITGAYRRCGNTFSPMVAGLIAIGLNTFLNFLLINGNLGFPALGVQGAAIATLIARIVELIILIIIMEIKHMPFRPKFLDIFTIPLSLVKKVLTASVPLTINEFLWGTGMTLIMAFYGLKTEDNYTSVQMAYTTANLLFVVMSGFAISVSVLIGQELGKDELEEAKNQSVMLNKLSVMTGLIVTLVAIMLSFITPNLYEVSPEIRENSANILRIIALYFPIYIITATLFFTLRAGGDVKGVLYVDGLFMIFIGVPIAFVLNKYFSLPIVLTFFIAQSTDILKLYVINLRYKTYIWVKKLI